MPLNLTDELVNHLASMPDDEVAKFYDALTPEEKEETTTFIRQRKTASLQPQTPVDQMDFTKPIPSTPEEKERTALPEPERPDLSLAGFAQRAGPALLKQFGPGGIGAAGVPIAGAMGAMGAMEEAVIDPITKRLQTDVGRPLVNQAIQPPPGQEPMGPVPELLARRMAKPIAGETVETDMTPSRQLKAVNTLEGTLGSTGAAAAQFGAEMVPQIPTFLFGMGKINEAVRVETETQLLARKVPSILASIIGHATGAGAEGAAIGGVQALISPEQKMPEGILYGGVLGAAAGAAGGAAAEAKAISQLKAPAYVGTVTKNIIDQLAEAFHQVKEWGTPPLPPTMPHPRAGVPMTEIGNRNLGRGVIEERSFNAMPENLPPEEGGPISVQKYAAGRKLAKETRTTESFEQPSGPWFAQRVSSIDELKPSFVTLVDKDGRLTARVVEIRTDSPHKWADIDVSNVDSAKKIGDMVAKNNITMQSSPAALRKMNSVYEEPLFHTFFGSKSLEDIDYLSAFGKPDPTGYVSWRRHPKFERPEAGMNIPYPGVQGVGPNVVTRADPHPWIEQAMPEPDAPVDPESDFSNIFVDAGHIKVLPEPKTLPMDQGDIARMGLGPGGRALGPDMQDLVKTKVGGRGVPSNRVAQRLLPEGSRELPGGYQKGEEVYVGRGTEEKEVSGRIVGRDPNNPGHLLVQELLPKEVEGQPGTIETQGTIKSRELKEIFPSNAVRIHDMVPADPEYGPPPAPGSLQPHEIENFGVLRRTLNRLGDKAAELFFGDHFRGSSDVGALINIGKSTKNLEAAREIYTSLRKAFPDAKLLSDFDKDLAALAEGKLRNAQVPGILKAGEKVEASLGPDKADAYMTAKYGDAWTQGKEVVGKFLKESQMWDRKIADLGGIPADLVDLREAGIVDRYLARQYRVFTMPKGEWGKTVKRSFPELLEEASTFLKTEAAKDRIILPDSVIQSELDKMLRTANPIEGMRSSSVLGKTFKRLVARKEIPDVLQRLMGKEESGFLRITSTIGSQRAIAANLQLWSDIALNRSYWNPGINPAMGHTLKVPNNPKLFGQAAGGYINPVFESLVNVPQAINDGMGWFRSLVSTSKMNEVALGGLSPFFNATMGNFYYSVLAGGINPLLKPIQSGRRFREAISLMRDYAKDPSIGSKAGQSIQEMVRQGIDIPGFAEVEMGSGRNLMIKDLQATLNALPENASAQDYISYARQKALGGLRSIKDVGTSAYGSIDRTFKIANYLELKEKFYKQLTGQDPFAKFGQFGTMGSQVKALAEAVAGKSDRVVQEAAARLAAERINQSFPNPQHVGKVVAGLRNTVGIGAKYLTYFAQDLQINSMLPKRLLDEPDLRWRLLGSSMVAYGIFGNKGLLGSMRRWNGISDEEVDGALADRPGKDRAYRPFVVALPNRDNHIQKDGQGRVQLVDLSQWFGMTRFLMGDPSDSIAKRAIANFITGPVQGGAAENEVNTLLARSGLVRPPTTPKLLEGEGDAINGLKLLWEAGAAPKAPLRVMDALRRGGLIGNDFAGRLNTKTEEKLTPGQVTGRLLGVNAQPYTVPMRGEMSPSNVANNLAVVGQLKDLYKQLYTLAGRTPPADDELNMDNLDNEMEMASRAGSRMTPKQKQILDAIIARYKQIGLEVQSRNALVRQAQKVRVGGTK